MPLTTTNWVSVDGVMQGLGAEDEDRRGGFERGGWAMPYADPAVEGALNAVYEKADAFLFGSWTFDVFARSWGAVPEMMDSPIGRALNSKPKYVASDTLASPAWAHTTVIPANSAAAVSGAVREANGEVVTPGGRTLIRWLLANDLVDAVNLFIAPVVVGQGERLFPDTGPDRALELTEHTVVSNGVIVVTYRPTGPARYGQTADTTRAWTE
ncbi:dihydrofolate reductase family protein [Microbacterium sp. DT81.1]|uniref:dihydrofolate reductase family protein n=1 Tax=Microbacterium sp. DT81.1 TaxID=3393413 RepID=UPI003CEE596B